MPTNQPKVEALQRANNDLKNLMEATEIAIIFVDRDFRLKRFTDKATNLFNLSSSDKGRSLDHFTHGLTYDSLMADVKDVRDGSDKIQKTVTDENGRAYIMRLSRYQSTEGNVEGVVVTFVDVTELKTAQEKLAQKVEQIKDLQRRIVQTNVHERWEIGQYLHDELAQSLVVAKLTLEHLRKELKKDKPNYKEEIEKLSEIIEQGTADVRDLSHEIVPVEVKQKGVEHAFNNLAAKIEKTYDTNCVLEGHRVMDLINDIEKATHFYRIAREAAQNAAAHGDAQHIRIALQVDENHLYLDIEDDGQGFDAAEGEDEGMGLAIMRHRMELMGGTLEIKEASHFENGGAHIACKMPLDRKE